MKKIMFSALSLIFMVIMFTSCELNPTDLMTANVETGGLLKPTPSIPYKLGGTPSFDISITIPKGPHVASIDVYKKYTGKAEVQDPSITVTNSNESEDVTITVTYDYAKLIAGLAGMPADETVLAIGDAWTLRYVSVMDDGRKVDVGPKSTVTVANKYAGYYQCVGVFHHPVNGDRPINEKKFLTPIDANSCWGNAGDLGGSPYLVKLTVDPVTNLVTCSGYDAIELFNTPNEDNYYDPADGTFHVSYYYVNTSTGNRLMNEVWTPVQ